MFARFTPVLPGVDQTLVGTTHHVAIGPRSFLPRGGSDTLVITNSSAFLFFHTYYAFPLPVLLCLHSILVDADIFSVRLPLVVHPLSSLPKKNTSLHLRGKPGERRLVLLSSLHNCFGCTIDSSLLLLFVCHASRQKQIMSQAYYQVCNATQNTIRIDEEHIDKDVVLW
jgi:hypothetical protein